MVEAADLWEQFMTASKGLRRDSCGSAVTLAYRPGVTLIWCIKCKETKAALPDWQPTELAKQWNRSQSSN